MVENGDIIYHSFDLMGGYNGVEGDFLVIDCKPGFSIEPNYQIIRCMDGQWSHQSVSCSPEGRILQAPSYWIFAYHFSFLASCGPVPNLPNAKIIEKFIDNSIGDTAKYKCNEGFAFNGTTTTTVCQSSTPPRWSHVSPCVRKY